jgi:hypothetical protein
MGYRGGGQGCGEERGDAGLTGAGGGGGEGGGSTGAPNHHAHHKMSPTPHHTPPPHAPTHQLPSTRLGFVTLEYHVEPEIRTTNLRAASMATTKAPGLVGVAYAKMVL